jgi:hypothetical protein
VNDGNSFQRLRRANPFPRPLTAPPIERLRLGVGLGDAERESSRVDHANESSHRVRHTRVRAAIRALPLFAGIAVSVAIVAVALVVFRHGAARTPSVVTPGEHAVGGLPPVPPLSMCGEAYSLHAGTETISTASCAGVIPSRPARVSIPRGERFSIEIGHEMSGRLDYPIPDPIGATVSFAGRDGATAEYVARSLGSAQLVARHTPYCDRPGIGSCTAFIIRVIR